MSMMCVWICVCSMWCDYVCMCDMYVWYEYVYVFMGCVVWVYVEWVVWPCDINVCESVYGVSVSCCMLCVSCGCMFVVWVCVCFKCVCIVWVYVCIWSEWVSECVSECECLCTCVFDRVHVWCVYVWYVYTMHTHAQGRGIACLVCNSFLRGSLREGEDVRQLATCPCGWSL